ncbi:MAG TPA: site-2 protease family protein [Actinomycetota bacterium]|nr:site-2 protease family protein [Actinomycetota bacterium]
MSALAVGTLGWLALMNLLLAVFNLLPGAPLDGGRVLQAILWRRHGDRTRAALTAARAGQGSGRGPDRAGPDRLLLRRQPRRTPRHLSPKI